GTDRACVLTIRPNLAFRQHRLCPGPMDLSIAPKNLQNAGNYRPWDGNVTMVISRSRLADRTMVRDDSGRCRKGYRQHAPQERSQRHHTTQFRNPAQQVAWAEH